MSNSAFSKLSVVLSCF